MLTFGLSDAAISIEDVGANGEGRRVFRYCVTVGGDTYGASDLRSGVGHTPTEHEMLGTLLAFLSCAADEGDDCDLFPVWLREWAAANQDEIDMEREEIESSAVMGHPDSEMSLQ